MIIEHIAGLNLVFQAGRADTAAQFYTIELAAEVGVPSEDEQSGEGDDEEDDNERDGGARSEGEKKVESRKSDKGNAGDWKCDDAGRGGVHSPDRLTCRGRGLAWVREHRAPRTSLFRPSDAERRLANENGLWRIRNTEGTMAHGRKCMITDTWNYEIGTVTYELRQS